MKEVEVENRNTTSSEQKPATLSPPSEKSTNNRAPADPAARNLLLRSIRFQMEPTIFSSSPEFRNQTLESP